ncbi:Aldehyde/histidinol dehydrogenase [Aspergillus falconensis]
MPSPSPFPRVRASAIDGRALNTRHKQTQLQRLQSALLQHIQPVKAAIRTDTNHDAGEIQAEIVLALTELRTHYLSLSLEQDLEQEYRVANGKDNPDAARPGGSGIVYVVPSTHSMFFGVLAAISAAIVGGCCVILELTKNTMALPPLLRQILSDALDADTFAVAEERPDAAFLENVLVVAQTDVPSLPQSLQSPVSAKTVAVVDRTANLKSAAESLVTARFAFGGRSTYAPDIVLVQEFAMKALVEAIIHRSSKYLSGPDGETREKAVAASNPHRSSLGLSALDAAYRDSSARVLVSGSGWGVVEVHDRQSALLQRKEKVAEKVLILHPVSSLDDAIDFCAGFEALAATYAFADAPSAKYLTQFIDAHISFINHVPVDLLISPAYPVTTRPTADRSTRYNAAAFQVPRPQFVTESTNTTLTRTVLDRPTSTEAGKIWDDALKPLPPTGQKAGKRIGFFEQGILTGVGITLFSVIGVVGVVGYYSAWFLRRL